MSAQTWMDAYWPSRSVAGHWRAGKPLWDRRYTYVDRPTEVEAYQVAVDRAKELGIPEREICDYLRVEWVSRQEHERLCRRLGLRIIESHAH